MPEPNELTEIATIPTVHDLRHRWKPHKERLLAAGGEQATSIRFHRACSWMARVEQMPEGLDHDLGLVSLWIAFNAIYGQWDSCRREPRPDRENWRAFVDRILKLDRDGYIPNCLKDHKRLVMSLLEDAYLSGFFWEEPSAKRAGQSRKAVYNAQSWHIEQRWTMVLDEVLERVYLMRCQLVHGAATYGGTLNRTSLRRCVTMMQRLLPSLLLERFHSVVDPTRFKLVNPRWQTVSSSQFVAKTTDCGGNPGRRWNLDLAATTQPRTTSGTLDSGGHASNPRGKVVPGNRLRLVTIR